MEFNNKIVINTRPAGQHQRLSKWIKQLGGIPIELPLLAIKPTTAADWQRLLNAETDLVIFISANAVTFGLPTLLKHWPNKQPTFAAIGKTTAKAIESHQCPVSFCPAVQSSEGLITEIQQSKLNLKHVTIVKGHGGRNQLRDYFNKQNIRLTELNVYQRVPPANLSANINKLLLTPKIDVIVITSAQSLKHLFSYCPQAAISRLTACHFLVMSNRIKNIASQQYGIQQVSVLTDP